MSARRGIVERFAERVARVMAQSMDSNQVLMELLRGHETAAGKYVTAENAMRIAAVNSCVRIISEAIALLPLHIYKRLEQGGREIASSHPMYGLLHTAPNSWQTAFEFREMLSSHVLLRGNAFAFKNRAGNIIRELIPLHPDRMTVLQLPDMSLQYVYRTELFGEQTYLEDDIFHLRGLTRNGFTGVGIVEDARETFGGALATEEYGNRLFANDASPRVVLLYPSKLSEAAQKRLEESWNSRHAGSGKAHGTAVLEEGVKIEKLSMSADDAQFLETRKFQRGEIAGLFRVPPHMIGDTEKTTSWGTGIEAQGIAFVTYTLLPWLKRWEQRILKDLIFANQWYYPEFVVEGLMRGSLLDRYQAYAQGIQNLFLNPNEVRALENRNPRPGGDEYKNPNVQPKPTVPAPAPKPAPAPGGPNGENDE